MVAGFPIEENATDRLKRTLAMAGLVGESPAFLKALGKFELIAKTDRPVHVTGETGSGKELVARGIHSGSPRAAERFVPFNCATFQDTLLEDALFGHEPGAFTDARSRRLGCLVLADKGTLFLDEVQALTKRAQTVLLRVIEDGTFWPVGSDQELNVDVRFVTATNASLEVMVAREEFRQDLFYRLSVLRIHVPPLRERPEDILILANHFIEKNWSEEQPVPELTADVNNALLAHRWPGNVRELRNVMIGIAKTSRNGAVHVQDLGIAARNDHQANPEGVLTWEQLQLEKHQASSIVEQGFLVRLMVRYHGNITQAAIGLEKERRQLGKLLKKHGIDPRDFLTGQ